MLPSETRWTKNRNAWRFFWIKNNVYLLLKKTKIFIERENLNGQCHEINDSRFFPDSSPIIQSYVFAIWFRFLRNIRITIQVICQSLLLHFTVTKQFRKFSTLFFMVKTHFGPMIHGLDFFLCKPSMFWRYFSISLEMQCPVICWIVMYYTILSFSLCTILLYIKFSCTILSFSSVLFYFCGNVLYSPVLSRSFHVLSSPLLSCAVILTFSDLSLFFSVRSIPILSYFPAVITYILSCSRFIHLFLSFFYSYRVFPMLSCRWSLLLFLSFPFPSIPFLSCLYFFVLFFSYHAFPVLSF